MNMTLNSEKYLFDIDKINEKLLSAENFVLDEEMDFSEAISILAKDIIAKNKKIILLSGPSSSGKTTTSYNIIDEFKRRKKNCVVISLDNFFVNRDDIPLNPDNTRDFESIHVLNLALIENTFKELINNGKAMLPLFDFQKGVRIDNYKEMVLDSNGVVIVEGIHALNNLIWSSLPEEKIAKVYISVHSNFTKNDEIIMPKRDVRLLRRMIRDFKFRATSPSRTISMWKSVCDGEDKYIRPFSKFANYYINTTFLYDVNALKPYVTEILNTVPPDDVNIEKVKSLLNALSCFDTLDEKYLPSNSLLREFIGGGKYDYA
ncbi:MAG: nucleoside kinase [Clostridia bacterium]